MAENTRPWATLKEAQRQSGFSMYSLRTWAKEAKIPVRYSGNTAYVYLPALLDPNYSPESFVKEDATA